MTVTMTQYIRPNGDTRPVQGEVPSTPQREANYKLLHDDGCNLAAESIGDRVSLSVEHLDHGVDVLVTITENGPGVIDGVCWLIDNYSTEKLHYAVENL